MKERTDSKIKMLENELSVSDSNIISENIYDIENKLKAEYLLRASILRQKSRINWIKEGDSNSKFFHAQIRRRNNQNHISRIWHNDKWISRPDDIKELFSKHFEDRFNEANREEWLVLGSFQLTRITQDEATHIESKFTNNDISLALHELDGDKAPGPDGFNTKYIRNMWKFIQSDFKEVIASFHHSSSLPQV